MNVELRQVNEVVSTNALGGTGKGDGRRQEGGGEGERGGGEGGRRPDPQFFISLKAFFEMLSYPFTEIHLINQSNPYLFHSGRFRL